MPPPVQSVNPVSDPEWNALLAGQAGRSFFHSRSWAKVLERTYGFAPKYFAIREAGTLTAALPMMGVDSWMTGKRGVSLPFTDDCEPLVSDAESFKALFQSALEFGKANGWKYVELRGGRKWLPEAPASVSFYGHELNLADTEENLFARVDGSVRRAIRKAEKAGMTVEISTTEEAMRIFYGMLCQTRKKHGLPPQPLDFFLNIQKEIMSHNQGGIVLAKHEGRPIASAVHFHAGERAIYKYGASDETFQQLRGNNLVMWEAIKWHARNGRKTLHLGRTSLTNEGLRRFKLGWGAEEHPIEYVKYDFRKNGFVTDTDEASGWHNTFFHAAPVFLSRMIGNALYKHWA